MHLKSAEILFIVLHQNMKLEDNTPEPWEAFTCKHEIFDKVKIANYSPYFITLQVINDIKAQGSYKIMVILDNLKCIKRFI